MSNTMSIVSVGERRRPLGAWDSNGRSATRVATCQRHDPGTRSTSIRFSSSSPRKHLVVRLSSEARRGPPMAARTPERVTGGHVRQMEPRPGIQMSPVPRAVAVDASEKRVAGLIRVLGVHGVHSRRGRSTTMRSAAAAPGAHRSYSSEDALLHKRHLRRRDPEQPGKVG
jgi:hypothetical protein